MEQIQFGGRQLGKREAQRKLIASAIEAGVPVTVVNGNTNFDNKKGMPTDYFEQLRALYGDDDSIHLDSRAMKECWDAARPKLLGFAGKAIITSAPNQ